MANLNRAAVCGYAIIAMECAGMSDDDITDVMVNLVLALDDTSEIAAVERFLTTDL